MKKASWLMVSAVAGVGACAYQQGPTADKAADTTLSERSTRPDETYQAAIPPEQRRALFGELHVHTALSNDAWGFGARLMPEDAFRFGRGEGVKIPAFQLAFEQGLSSNSDVVARRAWPLDFMAVTDHAELLGMNAMPGGPGAAGAGGQAGAGQRSPTSPAMAAVQQNAWLMTIESANRNYRPGKFTTFVAYEWTSPPIHRNVIFNAASGPAPFTSRDSARPEQLWSYLEGTRARGIDVLAIPHNGNESNGLMYDWNNSDGKPIDEAYAQRRAMNEPLTEIAQTKGASDTHPALSPNDEFANFEIFERVGADSAKPGGSYVRDALGRGQVIQDKVGANPFKYGIVGGTDIHNALSTSDESAFAGGQHGIDPTTMLPRGNDAKRAMATLPPYNQFPRGPVEPRVPGPRLPGQSAEPPQTYPLQVERSSGALTGVWAEENNRNSIFAALKRKETFATTGTRMRVRVFAGWNFASDFLKRKDWLKQAYAAGVPMGADLPASGATAAGPSFIIQAMKDPTGANLDRVQVIKIYTNPSGDYAERIFDVALAGANRRDSAGRVKPVGNTVNPDTGTYANTIGATTLSTVWRDPEFDARRPAVYYIRVLEIPTPRWSTLLAAKNRIARNGKVPATIQERAWSSPIWFTPPQSPRQARNGRARPKG